ncbi:hypothetical protein FSP39_005267 [Pinctada imbricata]|uniref:Uncharacterized protein n=1 Tax=Pinctada imbricata TaxID=66713 RepID=A0AA88XHR1_PINIB|nr:hypothetical protein FSP39_005267 [Pinctada imbricata]
MNGNYYEAIDMVNFIKCKLDSQVYVYAWNLIGNIPMIKELQRMSYNEFISRFIMTEVNMPANLVMDEVKSECVMDDLGIHLCGIRLPPIVFLELILFLSYTKLNEKERRDDVLKALERLVSKNEKGHIDAGDKCISWNILSTCQEICGDYIGAFQSTMNSLRGLVSANMPFSTR